MRFQSATAAPQVENCMHTGSACKQQHTTSYIYNCQDRLHASATCAFTRGYVLEPLMHLCMHSCFCRCSQSFVIIHALSICSLFDSASQNGRHTTALDCVQASFLSARPYHFEIVLGVSTSVFAMMQYPTQPLTISASTICSADASLKQLCWHIGTLYKLL